MDWLLVQLRLVMMAMMTAVMMVYHHDSLPLCCIRHCEAGE
jgi:hypothetical protein